MVRAMHGVDKVFLLSSPHPDVVDWNRTAIDAARRSDVELVVRSSIIGADDESPAEFVNSHALCDRYLETSGVPFVIVRPNLFIQNVPESTIPSIDSSGSLYLNAGHARISMVDTRDVAEVAAVALTGPEHAGAHYEVTGSEALSYADVAAKLATALGRHVEYVDTPDDAVLQGLLGAGVSQWLAGALVGLYADYRRSGTDGYAARVTNTVEQLTGRPPRTLDDLLAEPAPAA
jgi:uncharacterized protein YbjT (DUF2867 family)